MKFRLLYWGTLLSGNKPHAKNKHDIRLNLSPQLKQLIGCKPILRQHCSREGYKWFKSHPKDRAIFDTPGGKTIDESHKITYEFWERYMMEKWNRSGLGFVPLITAEMDIRCSLDILFLRPSPPGRIIEHGDIDNRLKVLIDALKVPQTAENLEKTDEPIYCLLSDDRLISEIKVVSDQLLLLPGEKEIGPNDAFLVVSVDVEAPASNIWHQAFG